MAGIVWYSRSDVLGRDDRIGGRLAQSFWNSLGERLEQPETFAFVNRGVFLTLDDSPVIEAFRELEARGSRFLSCGTCLDYFGVRERLAVGEVGSMALLQELMLEADKVITL
ncbi:MAG: DsrE family protein [Thermoleophilia bacterium]|nr:DsrE family protein [Thermoleophilia bacterium]